MIDAQGNNLIFLLCVPRSGSSLVTAMLQNHSQVFATQEMWFLMSLLDLREGKARPYGGAGIINQFYNAVVPPDVYEQACRSFAVNIYNGLIRSSGATFAVDKSPRYYGILEFLDRLFPQSKRIWLIRNPWSILASYKKVNAHTNVSFDLVQDMYNPRFDVKMTDLTAGMLRYTDYFASRHPQAYRLSYERLVSNPQEEMIRLCAFLGITYEEGQEKYGDHMNTSKSEMFYSMGVGDPFLSHHKEAHRNSLDHWKQILNKKEVEIYGRVLGARIFHELGYSSQLEEAQRWTGVRFDPEPDMELIGLRARQFAEATGWIWQDRYALTSHSAAAATAEITPVSAPAPAPADSQVLQWQAAIRSLERRLEKNAADNKRLREQLQAIRSKVNRVKSFIPFGNRLSLWASHYLAQRGRKS